PVCSCALLFAQIARETAGAASTRSSLRPLFSGGGKLIANLGRSAPRDRESVFVGWVERSDTHQRSYVWRWVSLRSTHPTASSSRSHLLPSLSISRYKPCSHSNSLGCGGDLWFAPINPGSAEEIEPDGGSSKITRRGPGGAA